jgi:hypothetical protein
LLPLPAGPVRDYVVELPGGDRGVFGLTWEAGPAGLRPDAVAGPSLAAGGPVLVGWRAAVVVPPPGASVDADAEPLGGRNPAAVASVAPFDELFDGAANAVQFRPRGGWPLALAWSSPPPRWPLTAARLLGVALLLGLACVIVARAKGPVWPFALLLLGAGLAVVDGPWVGLVPAAVGVVGGAALALSGGTRSPPQPEEMGEGTVAADGA